MKGKATYIDAIVALNSLQSGFATLNERRRLGQKLSRSAVSEMADWLRRIGHEPGDLNRMKIVHVAGTKGKGTVCAYVDSILAPYRSHTNLHKIGLYSSPHLVAVRERIKINSKPISETLFTRYFFEVWDALEASAHATGADPSQKPVYFRFLTLLSFHVFLQERVDAAIYEVGVGGELDSTNVIPKPVVTGITTLGIDHVVTLGDTIEEIAWHKAGIFKKESTAFSVEQLPGAAKVVAQRAHEKGVQLRVVGIHPALSGVKLSPNADFQRKNASLAIVLAQEILISCGHNPINENEKLPDNVIRSLEEMTWPGRTQIKSEGTKEWCLDGAHTDDSMVVAGQWFAGLSRPRTLIRILIFNQQSQRDAIALLKTLYREVCTNGNIRFQYAVFCTNVTYEKTGYKIDFVNRNSDPNELESLETQNCYGDLWKSLDRQTDVLVVRSVEEAVKHAELVSDLHGGAQIFVTGSLHLVGGVLSFMDGEETV